MSIIKSHDVTLYGGNEHDIILKPLCDEHLPLLYKWNSDPEVLYWTEGDDVLSYDEDSVHDIYGSVSQNALCFLIEVDAKPIGDCWLQKMNIPEVLAKYDNKTDVRRIDMCIGEKDYWNKGIGTAFVRMLVDYAFNGEYADVLHCLIGDYNTRSRRVWEKNGFSLVFVKEDKNSKKTKYEYQYALTKEQFISNRRVIVPQNKVFFLPISELQPSQLYISEGKLRLCSEWFDKNDISKMDAIPIKKFQDKHLMIDGHTRAVLAYQNGFDKVPCYFDEATFDMAAYATDIDWCNSEGVKDIADLTKRIVPHKEYEVLWRKRCMDMYYSSLYNSHKNQSTFKSK
jgi:RimJ/RimL family protein N-acetyltransferase